LTINTISISKAAKAPALAICSAKTFNLACNGVSSCSTRKPFFIKKKNLYILKIFFSFSF